MDIHAAQSFMREQRIDGWLVYDFRKSNMIFSRLAPQARHTTRRALLWIPADGEALLLCSRIDKPAFSDVPWPQVYYTSWRELQAWIAARMAHGGRVAMEYAPGNALPVVSIVDAGMIELVRGLGGEVVSSANLIQVAVARWTPDAAAGHAIASRSVAAIKDAAFQMIAERLAANRSVTELEVQRMILQRFDAEGLQYPDPPIVAVNSHSGDPHFEVSASDPSKIQRGDWVLIDLWARLPGDQNIYSDITWVGYAGREVPQRQAEVFLCVRKARDAALQRAQEAWRRKERVQGWQLDDAAREVIIAAGYGDAIRHRTGHSLSPGALVHGVGVNLDNLETHDTRELLPGVGFTIEPGVYLPEFGVRLEINAFVDPVKGPIVTSCIQDEVVLLA